MKLKSIYMKLRKTIQSIDLSKVNAGTVVRLIMMVISCTFYILKMCGVEIPMVDENTVATIVVTVFGVVSFLQAYWKNNSWTTAAQEADLIMQEKKAESSEL